MNLDNTLTDLIVTLDQRAMDLGQYSNFDSGGFERQTANTLRKVREEVYTLQEELQLLRAAVAAYGGVPL